MTWKQIPERIRTVLLWAPIPILAIIISPITAWIIFALLAFIATNEWRRIILKRDDGLTSTSARISALGVVVAMVAVFFNLAIAMLIPVIFAAIGFALENGRNRKDLLWAQIIPSWVGVLAYSVRSGEDGLAILGLILVITISSDSAAYFVGRALGRHKFAPKISPNKTWEGAIGGWVFAIIAAWIYCYLFVPSIQALPFLVEIVLFWILTFAGQLGDLAESAVKRKFEVKDSGTIFPGHGGVMDRFDSFAAVILVLEIFRLLFGI